MSLELTLFLLRLIAVIFLYIFLGALIYLLWRDRSAAADAAEGKSVPNGELVVVAGITHVPEGARYPIRKRTLLGRAPTSTIVIPDTFASLDHARIQYKDGCWWLEDRNSRNGTTVNELPVTEAIVLSTGDVIGIGSVQFRVELDQPSPKG